MYVYIINKYTYLSVCKCLYINTVYMKIYSICHSYFSSVLFCFFVKFHILFEMKNSLCKENLIYLTVYINIHTCTALPEGCERCGR